MVAVNSRRTSDFVVDGLLKAATVVPGYKMVCRTILAD